MEIDEDRIEMIVRALQHYAEYMRATNRDGSVYKMIANDLLKKPPVSEKGKTATKRKTGT
jgi:hypothetical protein